MTLTLSSRACVICGAAYTPRRQRQTCCSRPCRVKLNNRKPTADQRVAVIPAHEEVRMPAAHQFTDAEFFALIGPRKPRNDNGERMPMVTRTAAKRDTDESGICPVCGKAYTFPFRREGWRGCSMGCWEAARLEGAA